MSSDTTRTDAEIKRTARIGAMSGMDQAWEDMCHFSRELEREADALREQLANAHGVAQACERRAEAAEQQLAAEHQRAERIERETVERATQKLQYLESRCRRYNYRESRRLLDAIDLVRSLAGATESTKGGDSTEYGTSISADNSAVTGAAHPNNATESAAAPAPATDLYDEATIKARDNV